MRSSRPTEAPRQTGARAAAALAVAAVLIAFGAAPLAVAFPDGAPWEAAEAPEACNQCHFDASLVEASAALELVGLPERIEPGATVRFTLRLSDAAMASAGFLLAATGADGGAGRFGPVDARTSAEGAKARSTEAGSRLSASGRAEWTLDWTAPAAAPASSVLFHVWANAANDDRSPFGDATHRRSWTFTLAD